MSDFARADYDDTGPDHDLPDHDLNGNAMNTAEQFYAQAGPSEQDLDERVAGAEEDIRRMVGWYEEQIPYWTRISFRIRVASFVFAVFGVLLPILGTSADASKNGFAALALAGLLFALDRYFLVSHRWGSYALTRLSLLRIIQSLRSDYARRKLTWMGEPSMEDALSVYALCDEKIMQAHAEREEETQSWAGGLRDTTSSLGSRLARLTTGRNRASNPGTEGGLQVRVTRANAFDRLTLTTDDGIKREITGHIPNEIAINGVKAGMRRLEMVFHNGEDMTESSKLVIVKPDEITTLDITGAEAA
ncbi:MAG: SLATT domain-containing protein [Alphaproteobacteria bacterium]